MDGINTVELIGYLGSALVLVSMLMVSVIRLRVINLIGSTIFSAYALMIRSYPTAVMNICLMGINIYHLVRLLKQEKQYDLVKTEQKDGSVAYLLDKYADDIRKFFPDFSPQKVQADVVYLVYCDGNPAGLFLGRLAGSGEVEALLDYAMPAYRDTSVGRYLYARLGQQGYTTLVFKGASSGHMEYLTKMGYTNDAPGNFTLKL